MIEMIRAIKKGSEVQTDKASFCIPAIVESFDAATQTVNVKLAVNEKQNQIGEFFDNNSLILPEIRVLFPASSADSFFSFPIKKGDTGVLIACDCDIDNFLAGDGSITNAVSERRHDLTDSFFIPGFFPDSKVVSCDSSNTILKNGNMTITLDPTGKVSIEGASEEIIDLIYTAIDELSKCTVATMMGAQPLSCAAALTTIATKLAAIKR